jgi:hypothetical protein
MADETTGIQWHISTNGGEFRPTFGNQIEGESDSYKNFSTDLSNMFRGAFRATIFVPKFETL